MRLQPHDRVPTFFLYKETLNEELFYTQKTFIYSSYYRAC